MIPCEKFVLLFCQLGYLKLVPEIKSSQAVCPEKFTLLFCQLAIEADSLNPNPVKRDPIYLRSRFMGPGTSKGNHLAKVGALLCNFWLPKYLDLE